MRAESNMLGRILKSLTVWLCSCQFLHQKIFYLPSSSYSIFEAIALVAWRQLTRSSWPPNGHQFLQLEHIIEPRKSCIHSLSLKTLVRGKKIKCCGFHGFFLSIFLSLWFHSLAFSTHVPRRTLHLILWKCQMPVVTLHCQQSSSFT